MDQYRESDLSASKISRRIAVVDCGSNTFSMRIVEVSEGQWDELFMMRHAVFLGQGGFKQAAILPDRFAKGIDALRIMSQATTNYAVDEVRVIATSVLRDASNAEAFCMKAEEMTGWKIEVITGDEEAHWIHKGVSLTTESIPDRHVIMDIGGGSLEFIVAENTGTTGESHVLWKKSFDAGVARLDDFAKPADPMEQSGADRFQPFLDYTLAPLKAALEKFQPVVLVGSSGSFDTFLDMVNGGAEPDHTVADCSEQGHPHVQAIDREKLHELHGLLLSLDLPSRLLLPGMVPPRARMLPLASLLIQHVLSWMPSNTTVMCSAYALREGVLSDATDLE